MDEQIVVLCGEPDVPLTWILKHGQSVFPVNVYEIKSGILCECDWCKSLKDTVELNEKRLCRIT